MRILMTADTVGGVWTYSLELARALQTAGVWIELATMGAPLSPGQRSEAGALPHLRVHESRFRLEWMAEAWDDVQRAGEWLLRLEQELQPDLIHLNGYAHAALEWRAPRLVVGHSCCLSWWEAVRGGEPPAEWRRYHEAVIAGLRAADLVVAPTRAMLEALRRHYGPLRATQVIPNGRDAALFPPAPKEPLILAAGRLWDEAKNLNALAAVANRLPWPVYMAGEDRHPDDGAQAVHAGLQRLGYLDRSTLAGWLARASIYAAPARYEPFGLGILEAAYAGCALVLGDIPSLREVWDDAALYVAPSDTEALRDTLLELIAEPERRKQLAGKARARAFEYTPERFARGYLAAYRYLLEPRPAAVDEEETVEDLLCAS
jgi:glycosyltransferase involved in cell wall biosynthesis